VVPKLVKIMPEKFPKISKWSRNIINDLLRLSEFKLYTLGDIVKMDAGGILASGKIMLMEDHNDASQMSPLYKSGCNDQNNIF